MERHEINTLRILEAFEQDPSQTQRELSRKLKISLGLVNAFTKRLAKRGLFKVKCIHKNRIQYILTPKGIAEKTRLTYNYVIYSLQYYRSTRTRLLIILNELSKSNTKNIVFFGVSELAEIAYIALLKTDIKLYAIIDDEMAGQKFMKTPIQGLPHLKQLPPDVAVAITRLDGAEDNIELLANAGIAKEKIFDLRL